MPAHDYAYISGYPAFMQLISVVKQKSFCEDSVKTNSFRIFGKYLLKSFRVPPVVSEPQVGKLGTPDIWYDVKSKNALQKLFPRLGTD